MVAESVLDLHHVTAGYGETVILRDVSLSVPSSSVVALLGPNGAGKSTLLGVASGLLKVRDGSVAIDGQPITGSSPSERVQRGLCHIPDPRGIFPSLTVRENLLLQADPSERAEAIERAVSAFPRLGQRMTQTAGTMSGGEQQMLAVARAYVQHPRVVLLDEVSMGLAPSLVDEIFEFLQTLASQGVALLIVEQFVHRALAMADTVSVLVKGRIALTAPADTVDEDLIFAAYSGQQVQPAALQGA